MVVKREAGFGVAGFILGLLSLIFFWIFFIAPAGALLGIIFSSIQLKRGPPKGLAVAGLVMSILGLLGSILFLVLFASSVASLINSPFPIGELNQTVVMITNNYEYKNNGNGNLYYTKIGGSGVMYYNQEGKIRIISNMHVTDCTGLEYCGQLTKQRITVRTFDNQFHNVSKIYTSPNGLDLVILEIDSDKEYPIAEISEEIDENKGVVAIGYPAFSYNARELSISFGKITEIRKLISPEGYEFEAIGSDAYINFGSSGGGLFDEDGKLIGITTWGSTYDTYAIESKHIGEIDSYLSCEKNEYFIPEEGCLPFCKGTITEDKKCTDF